MSKIKNIPSKTLLESRIAIDSVSGCWNWLGYVQSGGYGQLRINNAPVSTHRLSWKLYNDQEIPNGLCVLHKCDNRRCINPAHLFLGTPRDNVRDCINKGRNSNGFCKGHLHGKKKRVRKLTDDQVREIRATRWKEPLASVAQRYGVSMACVSTIRRNKRKQLIPK
jgi:hypothetical protein